MVKEYLSRKGVPFTEHNVSEDDSSRQMLLQMGHRSTPVTVIGEQVIKGYNTAQIDAALAAD